MVYVLQRCWHMLQLLIGTKTGSEILIFSSCLMGFALHEAIFLGRDLWKRMRLRRALQSSCGMPTTIRERRIHAAHEALLQNERDYIRDARRANQTTAADFCDDDFETVTGNPIIDDSELDTLCAAELTWTAADDCFAALDHELNRNFT